MKEKDLINIGFKRIDVPFEESGHEHFYYYAYDIESLSFISNASDELQNDEWCVNLFDYDEFVITDVIDLLQLIALLKKVKK